MRIYVRQEYIAEDKLGKVNNGDGNDLPEDVSKALMDGWSPKWGASPQKFNPTWLKFSILAKKTLLISVERDGRFSRAYRAKEKTRQALG